MESIINKIHSQLINKEITCFSLVQDKINQLKVNAHSSANKVIEDYAINMAKKVDEKIANGDKIGLLEGIPFGVKDVYLLQEEIATASSDILKKYKSPYTATAIQKLLDAGAIPVVKENCDAFGHGSSTENTVFGATKNAKDTTLVAGGSSGGSAVNVAKDYTVFSIGGDTGGSIRQPAGYNGVYGLKPTYGKISRYGLMAYASSTDCVGPIAKSLEDIRIVLNAMSGKDYHDQTTFESEAIASIDTKKTNDFTVGYYTNFVENEALSPKMKTDFLAQLENLKSQGTKVVELDFYDTKTLVSTYYVLAMAETASNLARLDGTNYGRRAKEKSLKEGYALTRSENFTEETQRRIIGGNQVLSQGHSEEIYLKARSIRKNIEAKFAKDFETVYIILSPISLGAPPKIGEILKDPYSMYLSDAFTVGFSLGGLPTLTVPFGTETGMQITANKRGEKTVFEFAKAMEK